MIVLPAVTLRELATWVDGEVIGDGSTMIHGARPITDAVAGDVTFIEDERYQSAFQNSQASAAIISQKTLALSKPVVRVKDPLMAFVSIVQKFYIRSESHFSGIHPTAQIASSAQIGNQVTIGAFVTIGGGCVLKDNCRIYPGVSIGNDCHLGNEVILHPHVVLYDGCILGDRVTIHANSVIGADGFGYRIQQGKHRKVPQVGYVEIADDVEIGACTTIDRATFGSTRIGTGTKIDNLVMIGHNCQIGKHNLLVSQVGIAGSVTTGDYVVMAGQVGIADHVMIGENTQLGAKCGIHKDVPANEKMLGTPATPAREQMRIMFSMEKLPEIRKDLRRIKQLLGLQEEPENPAKT